MKHPFLILENPIKKLAIKVIAFAVLFFAIDSLFIFFKMPVNDLFSKISAEKMNLAFLRYYQSSEDADVLILGSSHAQFGIDSDLLAQKSGKNVFNLAHGGGAPLGNQYFLLKSYLDKKKNTKLILLGFDAFDLTINPIGNLKLIQPFIRNDPNFLLYYLKQWQFPSRAFFYGEGVYQYLLGTMRGNWTLPLYRNSDFRSSNFQHFDRYEITKTGFVRGYAVMNRAYLQPRDDQFKPDKESIHYLEQIVKLCHKKKIQLIFIQIPEHTLYQKYRKSFYQDFNLWIKKFAANNQLLYFNFNEKESFPLDRDDYFFDSDHLNREGALVFTRKLAAVLYADSDSTKSNTASIIPSAQMQTNHQGADF